MKKISFSVDLLVALAQLEDKDLAQLQRAIIHYANEGTVPSFSNVALKAFFSLFRSSIDEQIAAAEKQSQTNCKNAAGKNVSGKKKGSKKSSSSATSEDANANGNDSNGGNGCSADDDVSDANHTNCLGASEMSDDSTNSADGGNNANDINSSLATAVNENDSLQIASKESNSQQVANVVSKSLKLEDIEAAYPKQGSFRSESFGLWSKLSNSDRQAAVDYVPQYLASHPSSSNQVFLNQYLKMQLWKNK